MTILNFVVLAVSNPTSAYTVIKMLLANDYREYRMCGKCIVNCYSWWQWEMVPQGESGIRQEETTGL